VGEETKAHGIRFKGPKKEKHKRTITIDDDLPALLLSARDRLLRLKAGIPDGVAVDRSLVVLTKAEPQQKRLPASFPAYSKKLNAPYRSGPGGTWIKVKNPKTPAATRPQMERLDG
jgi:hypothetical protein